MILTVFEHLQIIVLSKYLNTNAITNAILKVIFYSDDQRELERARERENSRQRGQDSQEGQVGQWSLKP